MPVSRITNVFSKALAENRAALLLYTMAGDPNPQISEEVLDALTKGGADILELGFAFSDPMADGPVIQRASERALLKGDGLRDVLAIVKQFHETDQVTPVVLMGYANPIPFHCRSSLFQRCVLIVHQ